MLSAGPDTLVGCIRSDEVANTDPCTLECLRLTHSDVSEGCQAGYHPSLGPCKPTDSCGSNRSRIVLDVRRPSALNMELAVASTCHRVLFKVVYV